MFWPRRISGRGSEFCFSFFVGVDAASEEEMFLLTSAGGCARDLTRVICDRVVDRGKVWSDWKAAPVLIVDLCDSVQDVCCCCCCVGGRAIVFRSS